MNKLQQVMILGVLAVALFLGTPKLCAHEIALLISRSDTMVVRRAINRLELPQGITVSVYTADDLANERQAGSARRADVLVVDVMIEELTDFLEEYVDPGIKRVYAVRGSRDDSALKQRGIIFDKLIQSYYHHLKPKNVRNLVRRVAHKEFDRFIVYEDVSKTPALGLYHPDAESPFSEIDSYWKWYRSKPGFDPANPTVALLTYVARTGTGQLDHVDRIVRRLELSRLNVVTMFGWDPEVLGALVNAQETHAPIDGVLAFSLKFQSALDDRVFTALRNIDLPVFNVLSLYYGTIATWRQDPKGLAPTEVGWAIANPELSGLVEPSVLAGKIEAKDAASGETVHLQRVIEDNLEVIIPRLKNWIALRHKPNSEKRVAILIYNNSPGKQNVGASYLNVFESLSVILERLRQEGYSVPSERDLSRSAIRDIILSSARNVGNWAPGELEDMVGQGHVARAPINTYQAWFSSLPTAFQRGVTEQWSSPQLTETMVSGQDFIIPRIRIGNIVIMPEPSRGFVDDPMKLYHSPTLFPHHQYVAAYLWLKKCFGADAQIHLGTHGTHEWLPGKQAGLSAACPPDVLITDVPSLYPYIVDDVGEGIQAKRRGRAVVVDHLIPAVKESGLYHEYSELHGMISDYLTARGSGSITARVRFRGISEMIQDLGVDKDLSLEDISEQSLEDVHTYLEQLKGDYMPYGLHTFGRSPTGEAQTETVRLIMDMRPDGVETEITRNLSQCGPSELDRLVHGLKGGYVPPGTGNDPFRNPAAMPTGKNFYGFDPAKIPSKAAYELGVKASKDLIERSRKRSGGFPEKISMVLWATETIRNEGVNEGTLLHLMGMKPKWDKAGRVEDVVAVPAKELGRPRIDVLIDASGLYRDLFPHMLQYLDRAVQKAFVLTDIQNFIRRNSQHLKTQLIRTGMEAEEAAKLSQLRVFSEKPGNYGNRVVEITSASSLWESSEEIAAAFSKHTGYGFGDKTWGEPATAVFRRNLAQSDMAVHSISSAVYGTMDNDDMFQYLGGLSLAIAKERGKAPDTVITLQRKPRQVSVAGLGHVVGREMRTRYLNPKWIEGMKQEGYAGAREMSNFVDYLWGWQVTTPFAVDQTYWRQTYQVYVEDKYELDLKEYFAQANPWAFQSMTARMLESVRKGYWEPGEKIRQALASEYARDVIRHGISCCDHTCNNPLLNEMVLAVLSIPGVTSPQVADQFRLAVAKATGKNLEQHREEQAAIRQAVRSGFEKPQRPEQADLEAKAATDSSEKRVKGYKMEDLDTKDDTTELTSSGAQWYAALFVLVTLLLAGAGALRKAGRRQEPRQRT